VTAATIVAIVSAVVALLALAGSMLVLAKVRAQQHLLEREIERGKGEFDVVIAHEVEQRAEDLGRTMARLRADALSALAEDERRIAEERRRDVAERERDASERLGDKLVEVQRAIEQRLGDWGADVEKLQQGLADELKRVEAKQREQMADIGSRIGQDAEGLEGQIEEQRQMIGKLRVELTRSAEEVTQQALTDLDQHTAERRNALHEVAERLRKRERDLHEVVERESNDATQRIQLALGDIERRQVEQLQRMVQRETTRHAEAASHQFDTAIRGAREGAARRLSRELDLAVERFAREAEGVLTERLNHVSDAAAQRVEDRLARLRSALERQRDDALRSLEDRAHQVEASLRERLQEIATDAEAERAVLDARLHELSRKVEELGSRASV
jgi:hypothetical protein